MVEKFKNLKKADAELYKLVVGEIKRQNETLDLIASENLASQAILEVLGSELTNKYSEGYPGKRYYPGNFYYDKIEELAQKRALKVFKLNPRNWAVNVQPHSGSPANMAVYFALIKPGDTILGMSLSNGGHLTHGHKVSFSGRLYNSIQYGINPKTGEINYEEVEKLAKKFKPKIIVSGATAYPRKIDFKKFREISEKIGAYHLADISHVAGLIAAGLHPSPFPYIDVATTTTHKTLKGPRGAVIFINKKSKIASRNKIDIVGKINRAVFPTMQGGPHNNAIAAIALNFKEALSPAFKNYQKQVLKNAAILAKELGGKGFNLITKGTDSHLILIDLKKTGVSGIKAEKILEQAGIVANRNAVVGDNNPANPSGIRIGTPSTTARGMKEKEMKKITEWIFRLIIKKEKSKNIRKEVLDLCKDFPI